MIEVKNLSKRYSNHLAVDNISFKTKQGEILGLLGPNGAGKTTTMRILTGYMPPTEGQASVAGYDVVTDSMDVRRRVGYLPEKVPVYKDMTVQEYITFWAKMRGVPKAKQRVTEVLEQVSLEDRRKSLVRSLSKGLTQRLGLAQAIVHNPEVIILDEPTIGIDPQQVIEVRRLVRGLANDHTVLFSTHILAEAEQVCDRVVILNRGQLVAKGKPDALRQQLSPGDHIYVELDAGKRPDEQQIIRILERIPGVKSVDAINTGYVLRAKRDHDIRGAVSKHVAEAGYTLLELRPVAMTLEEIFLDVIGGTS